MSEINNPVHVSDALIKALSSAHSVTVLTGAGVSAESGIPTFRDAMTGLWSQYNPHELATPEAFESNPHLVMDWYRWRRQLVSGSAPNPGHYALAELERKIPRFTLITQNVDGLHQQAGSTNVIELHGSLRRLRCSRSTCSYSTLEWPDQGLGACQKCGSYLRPDIVWFGEALPASALEKAIEAAHVCSIFFAIGTSGVVEPAATLPLVALQSGAEVIEINPVATPLSEYCKYTFSQLSGVVLPAIVKAVWGGS